MQQDDKRCFRDRFNLHIALREAVIISSGCKARRESLARLCQVAADWGECNAAPASCWSERSLPAPRRQRSLWSRQERKPEVADAKESRFILD